MTFFVLSFLYFLFFSPSFFPSFLPSAVLPLSIRPSILTCPIFLLGSGPKGVSVMSCRAQGNFPASVFVCVRPLSKRLLCLRGLRRALERRRETQTYSPFFSRTLVFCALTFLHSHFLPLQLSRTPAFYSTQNPKNDTREDQ